MAAKHEIQREEGGEKPPFAFIRHPVETPCGGQSALAGLPILHRQNCVARCHEQSRWEHYYSIVQVVVAMRIVLVLVVLRSRS